MIPFGLKFSQMILHTETSKLIHNWSFLFVVLHKPTLLPSTFNPILTGLFESKFLLGGGQFDPPFQISAPKGPIAAKFCMDVKTHVKSTATTFFWQKIVLLWFMQIRCIIITYLLIFPTNRISEGQFLAESYVEAL